MLRMLMFLMAASCALAWPAAADPYWIAYEGNDFPENEGWERTWGNADGPFEGDGATRTLSDGALTIDSLSGANVYDFCRWYRPAALDPHPGEYFVFEWRVNIESVVGIRDPGISVFSDDNWAVGFEFSEDSLRSTFDPSLQYAIEPAMYHEYSLRSPDMRSYELFIDGDFAFAGAFVETLSGSRVGWGDVIGAASRAHWDYIRFGVVPEPAVSLAFLVIVPAAIRRRSAT